MCVPASLYLRAQRIRGGVPVIRHTGIWRVRFPYTGSENFWKHALSHQFSRDRTSSGDSTRPKTTTPGPGSAMTLSKISSEVRLHYV